ncbi:U3 small nucleolar RNA-interacting protein 2-like [Corticium candelabrum]|uniref:U3 small nucleolar RNA-interacting protein 2-like n=1 Tax=Corticium candelabrum TaxID=121492 RepID=UPI002E270DEF|nr:U3 small nucleolar RNA-interacting protein 2-like [Corticium candelabrum]
MSEFFLREKTGKQKLERKSSKGRKTTKPKTSQGRKQQQKKKSSVWNEEVSSDSDISQGPGHRETERSRLTRKDESDDEETPQNKRLRLAKEYLAELQAKEREQAQDDIPDHDVVAHYLREDVLKQAGKLQKKIASQYSKPDSSSVRQMRGHRLSITCMVITPDDKFVYTGSKDCSIIKWSLDAFRKDTVIPRALQSESHGHVDHVLCLTVSSDGKFLASGGRDKIINIWSVETNNWLHVFKGHRDAVSGLAFRRSTHQLFSCSHDRAVKIWNVDEMAYVDTLFGHQDAITGIDSLVRERAVTSGGNDRTVRLWKIVEESQLVFHGHRSSIDCIKQINEDHFISGSQDGSLALWSLYKKKPTALVPVAHGGSHIWTDKRGHKKDKIDENGHSSNDNASERIFRALAGESAATDDSVIEERSPNCDDGLEAWITAVASIPNSDFVASGSSDGHVKFWECGDGCKSLTLQFSYPVIGFVNALAFAHSGSFVAVGVGQEHRLGRWWTLKEARNSLIVIPLHKSN